MKKLRCYNVLEMIIDEANERFSPLWKPNPKKIEVLKNCCDLIDEFIAATNAKALEVEIDEITMQIGISAEGSEMHSDAYKILHSIAICFEELKIDELNSVTIKYSFPGIWERV